MHTTQNRWRKVGAAAIVAAKLSGPLPAAADEWQSMTTAPRDGSTIEIQNNYGVMPWYGIFRWAETDYGPGAWCSGGCQSHEWQSADRLGSSLMPGDESSLKWRPYTGSIQRYVDPTSGAQTTVGYWTGRLDPQSLSGH